MSKPWQPVTNQELFKNVISLFGFILALVFLVGEILIIAMDITMGGHNAYVGILIYVVGPSILAFALLLVPFGMLLEYRRLSRSKIKRKLPVIDLNSSKDQKYIAVFTIVTAIFLAASMVGSYQAYHITESNEFCGLMCHQVMQPEYTAYQNSPHARVNCVQCHIGPGADWFVRSKLSGTWQVYAVLTGNYHMPIDTPISNLRPARDTCEQCHWPEKFYEAVEKKMLFYGSDEENTPYRVDMLIHVGENPQDETDTNGIHWHIGLDHKLEYYARDEDRLDIPWVRVTHDDGRVEEFLLDEENPVDPSTIPPEEIRSMDCIDCHNRPSHQYHSPYDVVNSAFAKGMLDPKLPDLKSLLVEFIGGEYETTEQALETIESEMHGYYDDITTENEALKEPFEQAIVTAKELYQQNFFPEWGADWSKYPNHIGHFEFPGCYRCHDEKHKSTTSEKVISNDCNLCHTIIRQGEGWDTVTNLEYKKQDFFHPREYGDDWKGQNCHECHGPGMM
jgi:nitrate/TMAO reductase-like tetraheme cytochrome c subunit